MPQEGWNQVHPQRVSVLQLGPDNKRGGRGRHLERVGEGVEDRVDDVEQELGAKLAVECGFGWAITVVSCQG